MFTNQENKYSVGRTPLRMVCARPCRMFTTKNYIKLKLRLETAKAENIAVGFEVGL